MPEYFWKSTKLNYLSQYLTKLMHKICFTVSFISCLYMFRTHVLFIRRSKLRYTASGIITPIGGRLVHETATYRCDDTRGCVTQFRPPDDEHMCSKHVEAWNKCYCKTKTLCIKLVKYWAKYTEMHGQQNVTKKIKLVTTATRGSSSRNSWHCVYPFGKFLYVMWLYRCRL